MARIGYRVEEISPGQTAEYAKTVSDADILMFAGVSGDTNPVHIDASYAATTMFKERIAHGMLSAGFISTVLGTLLPGPGAVYLKQSLSFKAPVRIGDTVRAVCTVKEVVPEKKRVIMQTQCFVGDDMVIDGEASLMVPSKND
ncbi:MAG: MaoC family dehydratase [Pseudomonadota bacterium]